MTRISEFCNNPTPIQFVLFKQPTRQAMFDIAEYCIKHKQGNIAIAKKILAYSNLGILYNTIDMFDTIQDRRKTISVKTIGDEFTITPSKYPFLYDIKKTNGPTETNVDDEGLIRIFENLKILTTTINAKDK